LAKVPGRLAAALLVVGGDLRLGQLGAVLGGGVDEDQLDPGRLGLGERRDHGLGVGRGDQDGVGLLGHHGVDHRGLQGGVELVRGGDVQGGPGGRRRLLGPALHGDVELVALDPLDQGELVLLLGAAATAASSLVVPTAGREQERERDRSDDPASAHGAYLLSPRSWARRLSWSM
jgi:hypothetical protein